MKFSITFIVICLICGLSIGQENNSDQLKELDIPKVFLIGEYEEQYGLLYETYNQILLSVCHDDMDVAFNKWMDMLSEMESYAGNIDFDLNGVKIWLKVFWNAAGTIDHISFYRKPNSRNIDVDELKAFLSSFMNHYQMPIQTNVKFTHNGSAQFPTAYIPPQVDDNLRPREKKG